MNIKNYIYIDTQSIIQILKKLPNSQIPGDSEKVFLFYLNILLKVLTKLQ